MRLDKYLAHAGAGSRKEVKQWIRKRRVFVNGELCTKDDLHIDEVHDRITLDDQLVSYQKSVYVMLNKPKGVVSAVSDSTHHTVMDCIDAYLPMDCFPVGRLDIDTEGLLLICNDGKLAHDLLSPKKHVHKTYYVQLKNALQDIDITVLESGTLILDGTKLQPAKVERFDEFHVCITICEGKYHQVKRMFHAVHNEVVYLKRLSMGSLTLDSTLKSGEWRYLLEEEIEALKQ